MLVRGALLCMLLLLLPSTRVSVGAPVSENALPEPLNGQLLKLNSCLDACEEQWKERTERKHLTARCWDSCFVLYTAGHIANSVSGTQ